MFQSYFLDQFWKINNLTKPFPRNYLENDNYELIPNDPSYDEQEFIRFFSIIIKNKQANK